MTAPSGLVEGDWFLLAPKEGMHLLRSQDQGQTWEMIGGDPTVDELLQVVLVGERVVARAESRLWWSDDAGQSWMSAELPMEIVGMLGGEELILVGDGIWSGEPDSLMQEEEGDFVSIGAGAVVVSADGGIYLRDPGWRRVAEQQGARLAVWDGADLYVTVRGNLLRRYDGEWSNCGTMEGGEVFSLTTDGVGGLLMGSRDYAPYYSADRCGSWERRSPPDKVEYQTEGAAESPQEAYPVLAAAGERWVVAGWFGYWHSEDAGKSWLDSRILPADFIRGLAFAGPDRVYKGGYSYGVAWTDDGGSSFRAPNLGMGAPNVQDILTTSSSTVHAIVNHAGWTSLDGGESWASWPANVRLGGVARMELLPDGGLWILGREGLFLSNDDGDTVRPLPGLETLLGDAMVAGMSVRSHDGSVELCLGTRTPDQVLCSADRGDSWNLHYVATGEGKLTLWTADGEGLWLSDTLGLHHLSEEDTLIPLPEGRLVDFFTIADDGSLFFSTSDANVYGRFPGEGDWRSFGQVNATIDHISPSPAFSTHPLLLLATHDGVWQIDNVRSSEPILARWGQWERVDVGTGFAFWSPDLPEEVEEDGADFGSIHPIARGNVVRVWLRGSSLQVRGRSERGAQVVLRLDGQSLTRLGSEPMDEVGVLWTGTGLAEGWHMVELVGVEEGLFVDSIDGYEGEGAVEEEPGKEQPCGCQKGQAGLLLLFVGRLRRRPFSTRA